MSPGKRVIVGVLLVVSCLITYTSRPIPVSAAAGINSQLSFTGKMVKADNTNITNGTYNVEFKIYQDGTSAGVGSTLMWTEDYLVAGSTGMPTTGGVTFSSGTFSVNLGSICVLAGSTCGAKTNTGIDFNQDTLWLSVQIGNTTSCTVTSGVTSFNSACGGDGEMSPYIRLTAVPYALNAKLLSGIAVTALGQLGSNNTWTGTNTFNNTVTVGSGSATAFLIQDAGSNAALAFDAGNSILKVYENVASPTNFASISYASGAAIFAASSGTTQLGAGTGGNINLSLTGTADQLLANKTNTLAAAYSTSDFKFTRQLTAGAFAATGNVLTVEDLTTIGAGSSAPNVLYVNQNNTSATGNLILAQTGGGANNKFAVDTAGTVTIATGQSYTSAGTLTLDSASGTDLNIGTGANAHNTIIGNALTTSTTTIQGGTNSTGGIILQAAGTSTTGRVQIGVGGAGSATPDYFALDIKSTTSETGGQEGDIYYNTFDNKFRCFQGAAWTDCIGAGGGGSTLQGAYDGSTSPATITTSAGDATKGVRIAAGVVPTADILTVTNAGFGVTSAGIGALQINYVGGAAAVESSAARVDLTPGGTTGGTWNGLRIVANATGPVTGVTLNGIKLEGSTSPGAGTETGMYIGTGWDTGLDMQSGGINLAGYTSGGVPSDPAVPATDNLRFYAKNVSGRMLPKWIGPSGVDTSFQASFGFNRIAMIVPSGLATAATGTVFNVFGATITNSASAYTNPALATTNLLTSVRRARLLTVNTSGSIAYSYSTSTMVWRGNAAGLGGFFYTTRFGTPIITATNRAFVGLSDVITAPTNVNPTTNTTPGKIGVAINAGSGNWNWVNNVTGTAPTSTGLGANFPVNTTNLYELVIFSPPNGSSITYRVSNLSTGTTTGNVTVSTNIPAATTFLAPNFWISNGTATGQPAIENAGWYLESDL